MTSNTIAWWSRGLLVAIADTARGIFPVGCYARATSEVLSRGVVA
jgi:hypothetical protein